MTTVLVVSRRATTILALQRQGFEVLPGLEVGRGTAVPARLDAVLLDLTSGLDDALARVAFIRGTHPDLPVLVLGDQAMCDEQLPERCDVTVVLPPVSAMHVAAVIREAAEAQQLPQLTTSELSDTIEVPRPRSATPLVGVRGSGRAAKPARQDAMPATPLMTADSTSEFGTALGGEPLTRRRGRRQRREMSDEGTALGALSAFSVEALLRCVEERAAEVPSVTGLAQALLDNALSTCDGDAGVVLLRESAEWIVIAAFGLRPLEYRARLDDGHWVVRSAAARGNLLRIEDTDIARQHLRGLPLASRRHLLLGAVGDRQAILVVARDVKPFTEGEVKTLRKLNGEGSARIGDSLLLRALTRRLEVYNRFLPETL